MTEKEIELSMDKALKKLPFEIKKIKFVLASRRRPGKPA